MSKAVKPTITMTSKLLSKGMKKTGEVKAPSAPPKSGFKAPKFDALQTSTETVMVYTNMVFDLEAIYKSFEVYELEEVPLTKKRAHIDKKKIVAPRGSIVSLSYNGKVKGLDMRRDRPRCTNSTIKYFLNEVMLELAVRPEESGRSCLLNIMIFRDNFKIAGCNSFENVRDVIHFMWTHHLMKHPETWKLKPRGGDSRIEEVHFLTDVVMRNVGFNLGFFIDREKLNFMMNNPRYADKVYMSQYEPTAQTNVNIQLFPDTSKPPEYKVIKYNVGDTGIDPTSTSSMEVWRVNPYRSTTKKRKPPHVTLIVFSSSEIILSGNSEVSMRSAYNFFIDFIKANKEELEEKVGKTRSPS